LSLMSEHEHPPSTEMCNSPLRFSTRKPETVDKRSALTLFATAGTFGVAHPQRAPTQGGDFIDAHQADPRPFVSTKSGDEILASVGRFAQRTVDARAAQSMSRTTVTGH